MRKKNSLFLFKLRKAILRTARTYLRAHYAPGILLTRSYTLTSVNLHHKPTGWVFGVAFRYVHVTLSKGLLQRAPEKAGTNKGRTPFRDKSRKPALRQHDCTQKGCPSREQHPSGSCDSLPKGHLSHRHHETWVSRTKGEALRNELSTHRMLT